MRILIEGGNFENKGAEAMVRTVQSEMAARFEDVSFFIESTSVKAGTIEQTIASGCQIVHTAYPVSRAERARRLLRLASHRPSDAASIVRRRQAALGWDTLLDQIDLILDVSGLRYSDDMTPGNARRNAPIMKQAWMRGKPYILLPQSFGPFRPGGEQESICRDCLKFASFHFARDPESRQHLASLLGWDLKQIPLAPDIAFNFRSAGPEEGRRLLDELGLGLEGRPIVCLSPNMRVYERNEGLGVSNTYVATMIELARRFAGMGVDVLLMPHEIKHRLRDADDRLLCELIRLGASLGLDRSAGRMAAVARPLWSAQMKAMIGLCDLLIGSRFHAIIAALHSRVPAVAIGWSHKYAELLRDVGLERFVVDHRDAGAVLHLADDAWREREANRRALEATLPPIEAASAAVFDSVLEFVRRRSPITAASKANGKIPGSSATIRSDHP